MMVLPSHKRDVWFGGVLQIWVTRSCDKACFNCTQGSNLRGPASRITVEQFEVALKSLDGYFGVVGMFGGNPALHPQFDELCALIRAYVPYERRGLWCNKLFGKGAIARETFNPGVSNLNVHCDVEAFEEFKRDWPESLPFGMEDSVHSPVHLSMLDLDSLPMEEFRHRTMDEAARANVEAKCPPPEASDQGPRTMPNTEENRLKLIQDCDINKNWSAMICVVDGQLKGYFCEIAGAQAMMTHDGTYGLDVVPGWWKSSWEAFKGQLFHCHRCGVPLRGKGTYAVDGSAEQTSAYYKDIYKPKDGGRQVEVVDAVSALGHTEKVTDYTRES